MNSINTHIPTIAPQQKQSVEQSYNRNVMGNKPHHQSRSFESMLGKSDSQGSCSTQGSCAAEKSAMGRIENSSENDQSDFDNKFSQILKLLQQLIELIQKLQAKAGDKPAVTDSQPSENNGIMPPPPPQIDPNNQPIPVEPNNGTGAGGGVPVDLPPSSSDTPNIPAEEIDFPVDPDDVTEILDKDNLPHISVSDPSRFENEPEPIGAEIRPGSNDNPAIGIPIDKGEIGLPPAPPQFVPIDQPIPVEPDNGTGAGGGVPVDLPPSSSDTPNIPAEEIDFPVDPDDVTEILDKDNLPHISVSDPSRFENEPEPIGAETRPGSNDNPAIGTPIDKGEIGLPPAPPQFVPIDQPIPVEPDNGTGAGGFPVDLPPSSTDTPNIPAEEIDFPVDPDDVTEILGKDDLPNISVSDPGRFENEPELVEEEIRPDIKEISKPPVSIEGKNDTQPIENNNSSVVPLQIDTLFNVDVPAGSEYQPLQGIDSAVGKINTPGFTINFDLGNYGGINSQFEGRENYQTKEIEIDGKKATIATYFASDSASAERKEHPYSIAVKIPLGDEQKVESNQLDSFGTDDKSLTLHVKLDSADQYSEVEKIFKSITFDAVSIGKSGSSIIRAMPDSTGQAIGENGSVGQSFNDWFKEAQGDINGDKTIDTTDIKLWLKGEKG